MRGTVADLNTPYPLGHQLPALYVEDDFTQRFCAALDDVIAPVLCTLDNFPSYLDPKVAPSDFVGWLSGWAGLEIDERWPLERRRAVVAEAVETQRWRGTRRGLASSVKLLCGVEPEIVDSGGARFSTTPGGELPGGGPPGVVVRVAVPDPAAVDQRRLEDVVAANVPAHVPFRVEIRLAGDRSTRVQTPYRTQIVPAGDPAPDLDQDLDQDSDRDPDQDSDQDRAPTDDL